MTNYGTSLPQLGGRLFLTDGGLETTLIFHEGLALPHFAAFCLLATAEGEAILRKYFLTYAEIAQRFGSGLILESPTWRANADWAAKLSYGTHELAAANRKAIVLLESIRTACETQTLPVVISGCIGPRGDGYLPDRVMNEAEAQAYHREQVETFADTAADMVCALTLNHVQEAIGIARAARQAELPVALSFTVETDGRLPTGQTLKSAIGQVDEATSGYPSYYMINCAHPSHFAHVLAEGGAWRERIRGVRANASKKSHAELNESTALDMGDPHALGADYAKLREHLTKLNVMGGCCGTDHRHVDQIAQACSKFFPAAA